MNNTAKFILPMTCIFLLLTFVAISVSADESVGGFYWKDGIRFDSADKKFKLKFGGRIMNDWAFFSGVDDALDAAVGPFEDGTEFRRARLYVSGVIYGNVEFKSQYDFAGGDADFKDMYLGLLDLGGVVNLRVGHFKEPFGLEELTSSKYITFLERGLTGTFTPGRNTGLMLHNTFAEDAGVFAVGIFRETDGFGKSSSDNDYNITARLAGSPWYEDGGKKVFHAGVSYSHKEIGSNLAHFSERPEAHLAPKVADTGEFAADSADLVGAELAFVYGSASLQGEYIQSFVNSDTAGDPDFKGFYVLGSYFLTGESRTYKRSAAAFSRVKPAQNFAGSEGGGAWEVALRYSALDLTDSGIAGGELQDFTAGLNWYLNPNVRAMFNYTYADEDTLGSVNIFQTRVQVDF